jgi:hypothetical protein
MINLLRSAFSTDQVGGSIVELAGALALLLVGLPVFLLHWWLIQRQLPGNPEERAAGIRAFFLYATLLALLIPIAQNVLALVARLFVAWFSLAPREVIVGFGQTGLDNLIAIVMNGLLAAYFFNVLRTDWRLGAEQAPDDNADVLPLSSLKRTRRIYLYVWVLYGLGLLVGGVAQILAYLIRQLSAESVFSSADLANGLALALLGAPLWAWAWTRVRQLLASPEEQAAIFHFVVQYILVFIGVGGVLIPAGNILQDILVWALGETTTFSRFMAGIAEPLSIGIPLGVIWLYYGGVLQANLVAVPSTPRRDGLRRLYGYLLALIGWATLLVGLIGLFAFLVDALVGDVDFDLFYERLQLANALTALIIAFPLWLRFWLQMNRQASREDAEGDHARRSVIRKSYLYFILFIVVVGLMVTTGTLLFQLLLLVLGDPEEDILRLSLQMLSMIIIFAVMLAYHWQSLRSDTRMAEKSLSEQHSLFPVLILEHGSGAFSTAVSAALRREMAELPVAVHYLSSGAPNGDLNKAGAVVLASSTAANPPEAMRVWLREFQGVRVVVPAQASGWIWVDTTPRPVEQLARQVAAVVQKLAEGDEAQGEGRISIWVILAAVVGGIILLNLMLSLLSEVMNF